tara:strand:- start:524 stop:1651 length:1128 start_codon:yes stop_codon:yes gene_type:complete
VDLNVQAENRHNIHLLAQLKEGLQQSSKNSEEYVKSLDWAQRVDVLQDPLINLTRNYNYLYDIFLIDATGNILYTIAHESDLGTNLFTGPLSDTRFTRSVKTTLKTGQSLFSDLERYAPTNDQLTGFFTAPLMDELGNIIGVLAFQVQFEKIPNNIIAINDKYSNSSQVHYLLGADGYLRSKIKNNYNYSEVLSKFIDTRSFQQWRKANSEDRKLLQETGYYIGIDGHQVMGMYQNVQVPGVKWVLVSEINQAEALADAHWLGAATLILVVLTGLSVALLAIYQARRIVQPISQLVNASKAVSAGEVEQKVVVTVDNEIGDLAKAFNHMLAVQNEYAKTLEMSQKQTERALNDLAMQKLRWINIPLLPLRMLRGL